MGSRGYWNFFKNWQISAPTSKVCQHKLSTTLNFDQKLSCEITQKKKKKTSFSPALFPFLPLLCFALGLLCQCIHSLRRANPFDTGWIDSCWQDALCHFVRCHLIGTPQFTSLLLPTFAVARFCVTSAGTVCVPSESLNFIRTAVCWKTTCHSRHQTVSVTLL